MLPVFFDIPVISKIDLNKPKIEFVTTVTTIEREHKETILDLFYLIGNDQSMKKHPKYFGTTIISNIEVKTTTITDELTNFFTENYDFVVKFPVPKTLTKRVKIKSISKFTPKIVI